MPAASRTDTRDKGAHCQDPLVVDTHEVQESLDSYSHLITAVRARNIPLRSSAGSVATQALDPATTLTPRLDPTTP